jgi:hypothetical protein
LWFSQKERLAFTKCNKGEGDQMTLLVGILDRAAEDINLFNIRRLLNWVKRVAIKEMDQVLPKDRYVGLAKELHRGDDKPVPGINYPV